MLCSVRLQDSKISSSAQEVIVVEAHVDTGRRCSVIETDRGDRPRSSEQALQ